MINCSFVTYINGFKRSGASDVSFGSLSSNDESDDETFCCPNLANINDDGYQNIRVHPKIPLSDHESDDEPSMWDTDDKNRSEREDCVPRIEFEEAVHVANV